MNASKKTAQSKITIVVPMEIKKALIQVAQKKSLTVSEVVRGILKRPIQKKSIR